MRNVSNILILVFMLLMSNFSCINNHKSSVAIDRISNQETTLTNLVGSYIGNLPCVDCDAINTVLHLKRDHSYQLIYSYDGKSDDEFTKEGLWTVNKNHLILKGLDYQYMIQPDFLIQLDLSGNEITGELAEHYQLSKVK